MKKSLRYTAIFLAALLFLSLTACAKKASEPDTPPSELPVEKELSPEELKAAWEGVYDGESGVVVIRDAENGSLRFTVSTKALSLSGEAAVDGFSASYSDTENDILLAVSDNKLLLEQRSTDGAAEDFFEIFTRTEYDPYTFVIMHEDEAVPSDAPRFDMTSAAQYFDPKNRFSVTMPDIFDTAPDEAQPDDGIYMQTADGSVYIMVETMKKVASTNDELAKYLDGFDILAAIRPDGMVVYSQRFTDGANDPWVEFVFMRILDDTIVKVNYVCAAEYYDECSAGCSLISIDKAG